MKATAAKSARTKRYFNASPSNVNASPYAAASARVGGGVLLLFELRAQIREVWVRRVDALKLAEPRLRLLQVARLDERGREALQRHLVLRVCLERLTVLAYRAPRV